MARLPEYGNKAAAWLITISMAALITMLASCNAGQPDMPAGEEQVMLTLRLSMPGAEGDARTRAITANEENAIDITQLKVLAFKASGASELFDYEAPQVKLQGGKYTVTLRQSRAGEKYRLVVITNAGKKLPVIPEGTLKSDALKMITFTATGKWNTAGTTNYKPLPMWGETATAQAMTPSTNLGDITLLRALARIDVGCALTGETAAGISGFTLKSVSVYRTRNKGYVAPVDAGTITGNVVAAVSVPPDAGTNGALTYTCMDGKALVREIYVTETPQGTGREDNVCLVVGGNYGGSTNYYRVDLTSAGNYIPLKRNCRYIVNITKVDNAGYTTEAAAMEGNKTVVIATSVTAEAWSTETENGSGQIAL